MRRMLTSVLIFCFSLCLIPNGRSEDAKPKIDKKAAEVLKKMSETVVGLKQFTLDSTAVVDEVLSSGQKIQVANRSRIAVSKPNKLRADTMGDTLNRSAAYNGKQLIIVDRARKLAAKGSVPSTLVGLFDELHKKYGLTFPLADFLYPDPYKILTENVEVGGYVAMHQVDGEKCHHLAFRQRFIDWQIWVSAGDKALPRKLVITYKRLPGEPQHVSTIKWNVNAKPGDMTFNLKVPSGMKQVDLDKFFAPAESKTD